MIKFFKFLVPGLAASLIGLISLPAQAIFVIQPPQPLQLSTLFFSGNCTDCAIEAKLPSYAVTGTLVLQDYVLGNQILAPNFFSFSYGGSNLLPQYDISALSLLSVSGLISFALPSANVFHVTGATHYFDLSSTGSWNTGRHINQDMGNSGAFAVPEPATMLLMGAALAAAGLARRRRQR